jgi:TonB family protein
VRPLIEQPKVAEVVPEPPKQPKSEAIENVRIPRIDKPEPPPPALPAPRIVTELPRATPLPPKAPVQTGGFGDSNGVPVKDNSGRPANIASLGAFDLPAGPGAGNGTGGSRGVPGVRAGSVFAGATPAHADNNASNSTAIKTAGFGDAQASLPASPSKKTEAAAPEKPVEIIFKPRPDYTDEARKLRLEGEVLVRVLFAASGQISIVELVHGLGHGLDESAIRAAQQIRYKPALREGKPVDSTATVHIVFQLAF